MMRLIFVVLLLLISVGSIAETKIADFDSEIKVEKDASLLVTERMTVDSDGTTITHGIYRDFPIFYQTTGGITKRIGFKVVSTTLNGMPIPHSNESQGRAVRVKIGDPKGHLSAGRYEYQLTYQVTQELGFFPDHDELYWNVTGNNWLFPIENVTAKVILPKDAVISKTTAYTGLLSAVGQNYTAVHSDWTAIFKTSAPLNPGEGLTVVVAWQKGVIEAPGLVQTIFTTLSAYQSILIMLVGLFVVCGYYFSVWFSINKGIPKKRVIFPLFKPPVGFDAADLRFILKEKFDDRVFLAAILSLASKGFLMIEQKDDGYKLIRKNGKEELSNSEERLLQDLFYNTEGVVKIDQDNAQRIADAIANYRKKITEELSNEYLVRSTKNYLIGAALSLLIFIVSLSDNAIFFFIGLFALGYPLLNRVSTSSSFAVSTQSKILLVICLVIVLPMLRPLFNMLSADPVDVLYYLIGVIIIVVNFCFFYLLNHYTAEGQTLVEQIKGFIMFLDATEKQRMQMATVPELTSDLFERYLPYAVAFDVEKNWSDQFASILAKENYQPTWYVGTSLGYSGIGTNLTRNLSTSMGAAIAGLSTQAPGSTSGFGGGGSSGGGGGGGGGGGW